MLLEKQTWSLLTVEAEVAWSEDAGGTLLPSILQKMQLKAPS